MSKKTTVSPEKSGPRHTDTVLQPKKGGYRLIGHKGGSVESPHTPVESPDSLHSIAYAKVLDLISEGPIYGPVHGDAGLMQDIYLNQTPIQNADGSLNFSGVQVDYRGGTQDQDYIAGFPAQEAAIQVGVEVKSSLAWTQQITNTQLDAVRISFGVTALWHYEDNGDQTGYRIEYQFELSTDGAPFQLVNTGAMDGKTTTGYERTIRIDLPAAVNGWTVRLTRLTPNQNSNKYADFMTVNSYTTVVDGRFRFPLSAVTAVQFDAKQFSSSIPGRAYHYRGRIISVPTNYDAGGRSYTGIWDGSFQQAYTNNPAWVFYDLVTNTRYGAGANLSAAARSNLKWSCYQIGQYCDELVPDGFGNMEPRFTTNVYIQDQADATKVLSDFCSVFMGMVYEANGSILVSADLPTDYTYTFTNANVVGGQFQRVGSAWRQRYTVAQVSYNDMTNFGIAKMEVVQDDEGVARLGTRVTQITAFGCTSRAQAVRAAKWALITSKVETQGITFDTGLEHAVVNPGSIIRVTDQHRAGRRVGGRIHAVISASQIVLDQATVVKAGDRLVVNLATGFTESRVVASTAQDSITADTTRYTADSTRITADQVGEAISTQTVTVTEEFSELPEVEAIWTIESEALTNELYRVISIARKDGLTATIQAVQHNPSKYANIDFGTKLEFPPVTVIPPGVQPAPASVTLSSYSAIVQGIAVHNMRIEYPPATKAVAYQVQWKRDNGDWISLPQTGAAYAEVQGIRQGNYLARVQAINARGINSAWTTSMLTALDGSVSAPAALTTLTASTDQIFSVILKWGFPTTPNIIERTEIWYSQTDNLEGAIKLGDFAYPQNTHTMMGLSAGATFYFWGRLVDKLGEVGDWYPPVHGVQGRSSSDATAILEYLTNQITETQLAQALLEKIDNPDGTAALVAVQALTSSLAAMYTIKTQLTVGGVPYMAGIGVGVENNQGVITSQILLDAGRVAVLDTSSGTTKAPFVVQGGQVFINQALIGTGWITNAMIGNVIQSDNFQSGVQGWRLSKDGTFEVNGNYGGAGTLRLTNQKVQITYGNGGEAIFLGVE